MTASLADVDLVGLSASNQARANSVFADKKEVRHFASREIGHAKIGYLNERVQMTVVDQLLRLIARSIVDKSHALNRLKLSPNQRKRLRSSITFEIRTAGMLLYPDILTPEVSKAAMREAKRLGVDLFGHTWRSQTTFDRGRKVFHWEHVDPISCIQAACESARDGEEVAKLLQSRLRIAWILKQEDRSLTQLGFRSKRPNPDEAYRIAKIMLVKGKTRTPNPDVEPDLDFL